MLQLINGPRYFFKKEDKLKSRKAIDAVFKEGKSFSNYPLKVIWLSDNSRETLQAAVGVSSRNFKKATDRNRIKRLMREAYRLQKAILQDHLQARERNLSVFFLYVGKELPLYPLIHEKMATALNRLIKFVDEKPE